MADTKISKDKIVQELKTNITDEEVAKNLENCPVKNEFVRQNA